MTNAIETFGLSQRELRGNYESKFSVLKEYEAVCQMCGRAYDRNEESDAVRESGEYICRECWDVEE